MSERFSSYIFEAGCDEAGRGCLAGPVVAAAVILPKGFNHPLIKDSKKLSYNQRLIAKEIIEQHAIDIGIGVIENDEIDSINILQASIKAMHIALDKLKNIDYIIVDGNKFLSYKKIPHTTIIKGDGKFISIAAASIIAKTIRDEKMIQLSKIYPEYQWDRNKGYPTLLHRKAIEVYGISPLHRKSFNLLSTQLYINF